MKKQHAIALFGGQSKLAEALGITSQAISQWREELSTAQADRVTGAAVRLGILPRPTDATDEALAA